MLLNQQITAVNMSNLPIIYKLCRIAKIMETVNAEVKWRPDNTKVSPGFLIESLVISTLSCRKPLWKMHEFWTQDELDFFYPELGLEEKWLSDDAYARALDKFSDIKMGQLVSKISMEMLKMHELSLESVHLDTTSKSVQGVYEDDAEGSFDITYGYSKDKRPDLKQYKIGCAVQQNGLVVMGDIMAGNHSDNQWNPSAIKSMSSFFEGKGYSEVTFIGDSATVASYESLKQLAGLKFISRLPETFGIAEELKREAFEKNKFISAGKMAVKETSADYQVAGFVRELDGNTYRFIVVHSSALETRKENTQKRSIEKALTSMAKKAAKLEKEAFACEPDALGVLQTLMREVENAGFKCGGHVETRQAKSYSKRGRPKQNDEGSVEVTYHAIVVISGPDETVYQQKLKEDSTFVLITSMLDEKLLSDIEVLREYKHQNSVEEAFRFLKSPVYLGQTLLNRKERVEAMGYVFILVLMIACYLQFRVRKALAEKNEYVLDPGNKKNTRPSVKRIFEILEDVLVMITPQGRYFPANINPRILKMIEWTGFDPRIYLEN